MNLPGCIGWGECRLECHQPEPHCSNCGRTWREHETSGIGSRNLNHSVPPVVRDLPAQWFGSRSVMSVDRRNERSPEGRAVPMALGDVSTHRVRVVPPLGGVQARAGIKPGRSFLVSTSLPPDLAVHRLTIGDSLPNGRRANDVAVCRTRPDVRQPGRSVPRTISGSRQTVRRQRSAEAHALRSSPRTVLRSGGRGELQAQAGRQQRDARVVSVARVPRRETFVAPVYVRRLVAQGSWMEEQ